MKDKSELNPPVAAQRRRILGWMGLGIVGAFAINALPFKSLSRRMVGKNKAGGRKPRIALNDSAVKRTKKADRNG
jgi:hypothetical protein